MRALINVISTVVGLMVAWVVAAMTTGDTHYESDGKSVTLPLLYTVEKGDLVVVSSWLGIAANDGDSGDTIALEIDSVERQVVVPAALAAAIGDIIYIEVADVTGHKPDDTAYSKTAGSGKVAFLKVTVAQSGTLVFGIVLPGNLAS